MTDGFSRVPSAFRLPRWWPERASRAPVRVRGSIHDSKLFSSSRLTVLSDKRGIIGCFEVRGTQVLYEPDELIVTLKGSFIDGWGRERLYAHLTHSGFKLNLMSQVDNGVAVFRAIGRFGFIQQVMNDDIYNLALHFISFRKEY